jgi:hypothetical protein
MSLSLLDKFSETTDSRIVQRLIEAFKETLNNEEDEQTARLAEELLVILQERINEAAKD